MHRDAFTLWLQENAPDLNPRVYQPGAFLGAPPIGWRIVIGRTAFVYRVPHDTPDVFYVVLIERASKRLALHSPFRDFVRLLTLIKQSGSGIRWIRGHVEPTSDRPSDALSRERILAFYRRYLTAVSIGCENGIEWYAGDITAFEWEREKRKVTEHHPNR